MLQESKAGLAVGKLRSNSSKQVSDLAKEIVKKWKKDVEKEKQRTGKSPAPGASNATVKTQRALTFLFVCRSCTDTLGPIYRSCLPKAIDSFCDTNPYYSSQVHSQLEDGPSNSQVGWCQDRPGGCYEAKMCRTYLRCFSF